MTGRTLSEYRVMEKIGGGGMGEVYRAEDIRLKHAVALKFLPRELTRDPDARERFLQEARAAFSLDHPNICTVHGMGETDDGQTFIVMAFYEGETLRQKIARGPLDPEEARSIVRQVARGLANAHEHGIVHRDVKPANIMVTTDGTVKLLDFGLAKLADQSKITGKGTTLGTLSYMSPEQARGEDVDARTDIWSMGAVLYEMLSGKAPFRGEYSEVIIYSILNVEPPDISTLRPGLPRDLVGICRRCLSKERDERPASALRALEPAGGARPAGDGSWPRILRENGARRLAALLGVAALCAGGLWLILSRPSGVPEEPGLIAVVPFRNLTGADSVSGWTEPLQSLVDHQFHHLGIATYDINGVNSYLKSATGINLSSPGPIGNTGLGERGIRFLVDGNIARDAGGFTLQMEVQDLARNSFDQTGPARFVDFSVAESALLELIPQVTEYLHLQERGGQRARDLEAWTSGRRQNIQAHKALMQACAYIYRVERGGERYLRRAIELDSTFITPRVWLISGLVTDGQRDEAVRHYQFLRGIEGRADGLEQAMIDWSGAYIDGNIDDQIRHLRTALEYAPGNNILLYTLARLLFLEGDWEGTITAIEPATEMRWQFSPAYWFLAAARMRLGRIDEAIDALEGSMGVAQKVYHGNYGLLTALYTSKGDSSKASLNRRKFIGLLRPKGDSLWIASAELGGIFADAGLTAGAVREYRTACESAPAVPEYRDSLGCLLYRSGRREAASAEFETLVRLDPRASNAWYFLGRMREEEGRNEIARANYTRYLGIDSVSARADDVRRRLTMIIR